MNRTIAARSGRHDLAALKADHPVAELVAAAGVERGRVGEALVGRCPFHADGGRPNLHVYPPAGRWWCYRCGFGGDVVDWVMRREEIPFAEACARLAGRPVPPGRPAGAPPAPGIPWSRERRRWDRLTLEQQVVMNVAATVYRYLLWRDERARAYLRARGIPDWVARQCGLGYADGRTLDGYLRRRGGLQVAQELGLLGRPERADSGRAPRELLAGRLVVPELRGGQVIWLIGRAVPDALPTDAPPYLALPGERPVLGQERAAGRVEVVCAEGVFDWLTAVGWGLAAWSPCGTALPPDRLGFLARARVVWGAFDGDRGGAEGAERFTRQLGARFRPLTLPPGRDLNDLGRAGRAGRVAFFRLLAAARRQTAAREAAPSATTARRGPGRGVGDGDEAGGAAEHAARLGDRPAAAGRGGEP